MGRPGREAQTARKYWGDHGEKRGQGSDPMELCMIFCVHVHGLHMNLTLKSVSQALRIELQGR
jgi:hypothetical protein